MSAINGVDMANIGKIMGIAVSTGTGTSTATQTNRGVALPSTRIVTQFNIPTAGAFRPGTSDGT